jgi:hypothetical protein
MLFRKLTNMTEQSTMVFSTDATITDHPQSKMLFRKLTNMTEQSTMVFSTGATIIHHPQKRSFLRVRSSELGELRDW